MTANRGAKKIYLEDLINWIDRMKPDNRFTTADKVMWVNEIEGMVQSEALLQPADLTYDWGNDRRTELLVTHPHERIYRHYLMAQLSYANEEYDRYSNEMEMFNSCWDAFMMWVCRTMKPGGICLPRVFPIVRGETVVLSFFGLPIEREEMDSCTISIWQKEAEVLKFGIDRLITDNCAASVELTQEESLLLEPGLGKVTILITGNGGERYEQYPPSRIKVIETTNGSAIESGGE